MFGYDIGATSSALLQIKSADFSGVIWHESVEYNSALQGVITSMATLGALFGSMTCFQVADSFGRRRSLILASCLYILGAALEVLSGQGTWSYSQGVTVLLIGRLIYGFGCGFAMHGAPAYIGEMSPSSIRGILSLTV